MTTNELVFAGLLGLSYAALVCLYCEVQILKDKVKGVDKRWKEKTNQLDVECGNTISMHGAKVRGLHREYRELGVRLKVVEDMLKPVAPNPAPADADLVERLQQLQREFGRAGAKMVYEVTYK
ncbi:MAG: hypothetical protein ACRDCT_21480 [Shewanella sp.]